ncbi:MAG: hypothetical protein Q9160_002700, partial [Pyrenula sp. 1 TL-2023]
MLSNTLAIVLLTLTLVTCFAVLISLLCFRRHRRQSPRQRSRGQTQSQPQRRPSEPQTPSTPSSSSSFDKDLEANIDKPKKNPPRRPRPAHLNLNSAAPPPQRTSRYGLKELEAGLDLSPLPVPTSFPRTPQKSLPPPPPPPKSPLGIPLLSPRDADGAGRKSWRLSALSIMSGRSKEGSEGDGKRKSRI